MIICGVVFISIAAEDNKACVSTQRYFRYLYLVKVFKAFSEVLCLAVFKFRVISL